MNLTYLSNIRHLTAAVLLLMTAASCSDEINAPDPAEDPSLQEGCINFRCSDMLEVYRGPDNYASRSGGSKNPKEKAIKTLHIFFFEIDDNGKPGKLLTGTGYDNFEQYQKITNASFLRIPVGGTLFESDPEYVHVVAIANIDATDDASDASDNSNAFYVPGTTHGNNGKIQKNGRNAGGDPYQIDNYSQLEAWVYYPRIRMSEDGTHGDISSLPEAGMPMIGEADINIKQTNSKPIVNMIALMAKVNVSVRLDPDEGYWTDQYPVLKITEYGVRNMPVAVPFRQPKGVAIGDAKTNPIDPSTITVPKDDPNYEGPGSFSYYMDNYDVTKESMFHIGGSTNSADHVACDPAEHEFTTTVNVTINKDSPDDAANFTYYTFENINLPNYFAERANGMDAYALTGGNYVPQYPPGVDSKAHQRWKSTLAYEYRASALVLKGEYTTHQGLTYQAQFTVYMGKDADSDFQVKRNNQYDNNITIKGLEYIRNSTDDVYTFDGRVNVRSDNMYYLSIVNERKIDAHASVLPMDIWLMDREDTSTPAPDYNTDITFDIPDAYKSWIQMVYLPREEMESADGRFYAGTGCEHYFYERLLNDIRNDDNEPQNVVLYGGKYVNGDTENTGYPGHILREINGLQYGAQCGSTVVMRSTPELNNSRSRIYFYIDENVEAADSLGSTDRKAIVKVKYKSYYLSDTGDTTLVVPERYRTIDIEQKGLRRVRTRWIGNDATYDNIPETYIEYYEEYLDHNDPLEEHESGEIYEGLEWGMNNININYTFYNLPWPAVEDNRTGFSNPESATRYSGNAHNIYYKTGAFPMTKWAVERTKENGYDLIRNIHLINKDKDNKPASAFHYCYGKNKRQYDGSVSLEGSKTTGWYMPGIRELETALVQYYDRFDDFRQKYYWSCACVPPPNGDYSHDDHHARSTMVSVTNGKAQYINSAASSDGGYKPRTGEQGVLRIRAFYKRN